MRTIECVVLDGFHKGHVVRLPYHPTIRLYKPKTQTVDFCCGGEDIGELKPDEILEYKECFRAADGMTVLYSVKGASMETVQSMVGPGGTLYAERPWGKRTTLRLGFHGE